MTEDNNNDRDLETLLEYLKEFRGFDFTGYKRDSLKRRISKQMQSKNIENIRDYLDYLQVNPEEFKSLFNTILINVTSFFRDLEAWKYLENQIFPSILSHKSKKMPIRIWSAGCASGEEAYTVAIVLARIIGQNEFRDRVKIYATDVDEEALSTARSGIYSGRELQAIPEAIRDEYFESIGNNQYLFRSDLRRVIIFGRHDLVQDPPISHLDLLVCRNVLMYFNVEIQFKILNSFHFALKPKGFLFLGKAEMLLSYSNLFEPIHLQHRIFSPITNSNRRDLMINLSNRNNLQNNNDYSQDSQVLTELAFDSASVPQIVVDSQGNLVLANTRARSMFKIPTINLGSPLQDLEVSYRPLELRSHIEEVYRTGQSKLVTDVILTFPEEINDAYLKVIFQPLKVKTNQIKGVSISFIDNTVYHELQEQLQQSKQKLENYKEQLKSSNEEFETTNEELQSTNEELETTNEELQSTNEELETINEELQSTNEELQTINDQLQVRTEELNLANAFLNSILSGLKSAVVVLDSECKIVSWNEEAENLWGLRANEVRGMSLFLLDIGLPVELLQEPIYRCLAGEQTREETKIEAINSRGKTIRCRIHYNPLIDAKNECKGVILLMEEI